MADPALSTSGVSYSILADRLGSGPIRPDPGRSGPVDLRRVLLRPSRSLRILPDPARPTPPDRLRPRLTASRPGCVTPWPRSVLADVARPTPRQALLDLARCLSALLGLALSPPAHPRLPSGERYSVLLSRLKPCPSLLDPRRPCRAVDGPCATPRARGSHPYVIYAQHPKAPKQSVSTRNAAPE